MDRLLRTFDHLLCWLFGHVLDDWTDPATGLPFRICLSCGTTVE